MPQTGSSLDRDEFFAQLDQLTPREIKARLPMWDRERLVLLEEYFAKHAQGEAPKTNQLRQEKSGIANIATDRTIAAALIALGLVLGALILRGGYEIAGSSFGAYVVNRFTGATWQCLNTCVRVETRSREQKK
jgi:hypothetical protein